MTTREEAAGAIVTAYPELGAQRGRIAGTLHWLKKLIREKPLAALGLRRRRAA